MRKNYFYLLVTLLVVLFLGCGTKRASYELKSLDGYNVLMDKSFDENKDPIADSILNVYKAHTVTILDSVIGYSKVFMDKGLREESVLGNFAADIIATAAEEIFDTKVDMGLMNRGGLRTSLPQGEITLGDIFKVFPFENHVTIVEIKGNFLKQLFEDFAATNVQCLSRVKLVIENKEIKTLLVDGKTIDNEKIYKIGTIDFIAEGNDNMKVLKNAVNRYDSPILIRDAVAKYVYNNSPVDSKKDGRIINN
ncbi:MAG: 5'-nucleotidase C-terminal domain-containing protein [Bacteroidales bacterium]|jgi:2',3'-cyclic-nucleotide 2'-phosphodiesterase (5'-nucleotidase family)|nr:5'-nucleotidase C-terminal domain-containing protein [Bacteroidales bacterium]